MDKIFKGWIGHTRAGSPTVRSRHPVNGKQLTHITFRKDYRVQVDGIWRDAEWAAKMYLRKLESDCFTGKMGFATATEPLEELIEKYLEEKQNLAFKTLEHYANSLKHFRGEFPTWDNFTEEGLRTWKQKLLAKGLSNNSVYGTLNDVSMFCNWLVENKKIGVSPFPKKHFKMGITPPQPRFFTTKQFLDLQRALEGLSHHAMVGCRLAHDFGLREIEIVGNGNDRPTGVLWDDVIERPDGGFDLLIRADVTKGSKRSRKLHLDDAFMALIGSRTTGPLVPLDRGVFWRLFKKARKLSGIDPKLTVHGLRHTFAKDYMQAGGTLRELSVLMGHTNEETSKIYAQFERTHLDDRQNKLSEKRALDQAIVNAEEQVQSKKIEIVELKRTVMHQDAPITESIENGKHADNSQNL